MKRIKNFKFETAFVVFFLLSLFAILSEKSILQSVYIIDVNKGLNQYLYSDAALGGVTQTSDLLIDSHFQWECTLKKEVVDYPFCGLGFSFDKDIINGVDFSQVSELKVWLDYEGTADTIRISLKNYNPLYSTAEEASSLKPNDLDIRKEYLLEGFTISLSSFSVPNWWKLQQKVPPHLSIPEFKNITLLNIQTGSDVTYGVHKFKLKKIALVGQWISTEAWYLSILVFWLPFVLRAVILMREMNRVKKRELELLVLNSLLDKQSKVLKNQAHTDKLTGVFNRQGVEDAIALALREWEEESIQLSIVMLDIDHFKSINDNFGHAVGDIVLSELATLVQGNIRSTDRFARWGGEEFVLICRDTTLDIAVKIAEKLRDRIAGAELVDGVSVTASFGVANITNKSSIEELFKYADRARS